MFINLQPQTRNQAMDSLVTLTAECRAILARHRRTASAATRAAIMRQFDEANRQRQSVARDFGLIGFAMGLNGATDDQVELVLAQEG